MSNYQKISDNIQKIIIDNPKIKGKLTWLNVSRAGKKELEYLRKKYGFELAHLQASSAKVIAERPIFNQKNNYFFITLHFPIFKDGNIIPAEINFFISHGYLITLNNSNIETLNNFFNTCKKDCDSVLAFQFESSAVLLYELLEKLMISCYPLLDKNSVSINKVQEMIFSQEQKKSVAEILLLKRNIINLRKIMLNHKNILKGLMEMKSAIVSHAQIKHYYLFTDRSFQKNLGNH
ncbi:MAG: CorA family divalent cation transporter [Patescibacteria group bacterium]|nr:CorA family divalent cation transporter [Patescibacteria group bacterium]MDD4611206.1 CorA family divalent cation transporter [Patescibacteria group bacterium]